jgi:hypothetical protein
LDERVGSVEFFPSVCFCGIFPWELVLCDCFSKLDSQATSKNAYLKSINITNKWIFLTKKKALVNNNKNFPPSMLVSHLHQDRKKGAETVSNFYDLCVKVGHHRYLPSFIYIFFRYVSCSQILQTHCQCQIP